MYLLEYALDYTANNKTSLYSIGLQLQPLQKMTLVQIAYTPPINEAKLIIINDNLQIVKPKKLKPVFDVHVVIKQFQFHSHISSTDYYVRK